MTTSMGKFIKRGSLIHEEKPFIHVLSSNFRNFRCDNCYSKDELLKCSGCQYVRYCGRLCQKESWADHKRECVFMRKLPKNKDIPNAARLIARIIMKLKRGGDTEKGFYMETKYRCFKDLMSHYPSVKEDKKKAEHIVALYEVLRSYIGEENLPNSAEFLGIYGRMVVNSFNILDPEMSSIGTGIYLGASTIDHSCVPNAVATFQGTKICIRVLEDQPNFDWFQVRISYIELLRSRQGREADLLGQYYFCCDCPRCSDPEEEALASALLCPDESCAAPVPTNSVAQGLDGDLTCPSCNQRIPKVIYDKFTEATRYTREQHEEMKNFAYLDVCKACLSKQEGLMHPLNLDHVMTLDLAFESSIQLTRWSESETFGERVIRGYRHYYGDFHPLLGIHYMRLGKIYLFKGEMSKALAHLEKAEEIIGVTHGKTHELFKEQLCPLMLEAKLTACQINGVG